MAAHAHGKDALIPGEEGTGTVRPQDGCSLHNRERTRSVPADRRRSSRLRSHLCPRRHLEQTPEAHEQPGDRMTGVTSGKEININSQGVAGSNPDKMRMRQTSHSKRKGFPMVFSFPSPVPGLFFQDLFRFLLICPPGRL